MIQARREPCKQGVQEYFAHPARNLDLKPMLDEPVEDVTPVSAPRPLESFGLRSRPSYGQLMRWAAWSRRMG